MSEYAAGYWQTRAVEFDENNWARLRPDGKHETTVTQQFGADVIAIVWGDDDTQAVAHARLIAAAPDLFEACKEFVRKVECGEARSKRSYAQMKAAIARARGEEQ